MHSFIVFCARYLFLVPVALLALAFVLLEPRLRRSLFLRLFGVALFGAGFAVLGRMVYHGSASLDLHILMSFIPHWDDIGFPSEHTLVAASCSLLLMPYRATLAVLSLVATALVAWARVVSAPHSPSDVLASCIAAIIACALAHLLVRKYQKPVPWQEPAYNRHKPAA